MIGGLLSALPKEKVRLSGWRFFEAGGGSGLTDLVTTGSDRTSKQTIEQLGILLQSG